MYCPALENYVPKNKEIKFCLFNEARWLRLLIGLGKPYEHIIEGLIEIAEYWHSDICETRERELTIKWIAERLNETPQNINKWLPRIYFDLFELNDSKPELFASEGEILCTFLLSGFEYDRTRVQRGRFCLALFFQNEAKRNRPLWTHLASSHSLKTSQYSS